MNSIKFTPNSGLGWIDFSEEDKGKVMKVIELLKAEGTVDELGIGVIRNSLSDAMFNGITTIQTRAKYFFIVPRILQSYLIQKKHKVSALKYLYDEETRIMNELTWSMDNPSEKGIIGYTVALENKNQNIPKRRWRQVERKPSTIYWNGLRAFKFLNTQLSLANLLKAIENNELTAEDIGFLASNEEKGDDADYEGVHNVYINLPFEPHWETDLNIQLTDEEASFLKHQIIDTQKDQLLAQVLSKKDWIKQFLDAKDFDALTLMPFINELPIETQEIISTASSFWKIFKGAHIRYNVMLQNHYGSSEKAGEFIDRWESWKLEMDQFNWSDFNKDLMWEITTSHSRVKPRTSSFINNWIEGIQSNQPIEHLDGLVKKQEKDNKGSRAKLNDSNDEHYSGWVGIGNMEYRFNNAKQIIRDIANGLNLTYD